MEVAAGYAGRHDRLETATRVFIHGGRSVKSAHRIRQGGGQGERMNFTEHRITAHDGLSLYYRSYGGSGQVVLCLPGLTRNCKDFHVLATHLASQPGQPWRVICPDLRGRGQSGYDRNYHHYQPATYVRDTWRLLDQAAIDQVIIIGTSLGGLMAMIMASQQAGRLRAVVLNDIGPEIPPQALARIVRYAATSPPVRDWQCAALQVKEVYEIAYPDMPESFWRDYARLSYRENEMGVPAPQVDPGVGLALRKPSFAFRLLQRLQRAGLIRRVGGVPLDPWDTFQAMTMPGLLLRGALSDVLTVDIVERMRQAKPDLRVVTVPGRGHAPLLDEPIARGAIDEFLAAPSRPPRRQTQDAMTQEAHHAHRAGSEKYQEAVRGAQPGD